MNDVEQTSTTSDAPGCVAFWGRSRCTSPVVLTAIVGCVHEHIGQQSVCQYDAESLAHGLMNCLDCLLVDGHTCVVHVLREVGR